MDSTYGIIIRLWDITDVITPTGFITISIYLSLMAVSMATTWFFLEKLAEEKADKSYYSVMSVRDDHVVAMEYRKEAYEKTHAGARVVFFLGAIFLFIAGVPSTILWILETHPWT